jgi:hypothetical protein
MLTNTFYWSVHRHQVFGLCRRRYYYHHYGSWGGWLPEADAIRKRLYRLKRMTSVPLLADEVVYRTIRKIIAGLTAGQRVPESAAQRMAMTSFKAHWVASSNCEWLIDPRRANLFEHYYGRRLSGAQKLSAKTRIIDSLEGFYRSGAYRQLSSLPAVAFLANDVDAASFELDGIPVQAQPACATRTDDGLMIYDWHGGGVRDDRLLLGVYQLYGASMWGGPPDHVQSQVVYLRSHPPATTTEAMAPEALHVFIRNSAGDMRGCLDDPAENRASPDRFPMTNDRSQCERCRFKEVCYDGNEEDIGGASDIKAGDRSKTDV